MGCGTPSTFHFTSWIEIPLFIIIIIIIILLKTNFDYIKSCRGTPKKKEHQSKQENIFDLYSSPLQRTHHFLNLH